MGRMLLINPARLQATVRDSALRKRYDYPPIGLLAMASHLMMHGERVDVLDFFNAEIYSRADFIDFLQIETDPQELVGISTYTETFDDALLIARAFKSCLPQTHVVLGGTHATFAPAEAFAASDVDYVVPREGEGALLELLSYLRHGGPAALSDIPTLIWRDGAGALVANRNRGHMTHRIFVSLSVLDDTFLVDQDRLRDFCAGLEATGFRGGWACKSRVDTITDDNVRMIADSRCIAVHIGFESASDEVLRRIGKQITVAEALEAILKIRRHGMRLDVSFIIGHPFDTRESMEQTLLLGKLLKISKRELPCSDYHLFDLNTPIYETDTFTADDQREILYLDNTANYESLLTGGLQCDHQSFLAGLEGFILEAEELVNWGSTPKTAEGAP